MTKQQRICLILLIPVLAICTGGPTLLQAGDQKFTDTFPLDGCTFSTTGRNAYFVLLPGYKLVLEDKDVRLEVTVLEQTRVIDGVETRIIEERETEGGELKEISNNYFAICRESNSVFYFGEASAEYKKGKVVTRKGSWEAGVAGARPGLYMSSIPLLGARYFMEVAPGVAMDRAEIVSLDTELQTPAGTFQKALRVKESSSLEIGHGFKLYAPGVGMIQDGSLRLVSYSQDFKPDLHAQGNQSGRPR